MIQKQERRRERKKERKRERAVNITKKKSEKLRRIKNLLKIISFEYYNDESEEYMEFCWASLKRYSQSMCVYLLCMYVCVEISKFLKINPPLAFALALFGNVNGFLGHHSLAHTHRCGDVFSLLELLEQAGWLTAICNIF